MGKTPRYGIAPVKSRKRARGAVPIEDIRRPLIAVAKAITRR